MNKKILILVIVLFFISLSAVSAQDNETVLSEGSPIQSDSDDLAVDNDTAISISTSVSNSKFYIGNQTEITVTVKNVGNCDVENLTILNLQTLGIYSINNNWGYGKEIVMYLYPLGFVGESPTVNTLHYNNLESINGSWIYTTEGHDSYSSFSEKDFNLFVLNGTLKVNQSSSFKIIYNTTKAPFCDYDNVFFFAYSNTSMLNYTYNTLYPSQIPRTIYIYRSIRDDSLIVNARISSLDNSVVSGKFYLKILDKDIFQKDVINRAKFDEVGIDFVNNTGNATVKFPLNNHPYYSTGVIVGVRMMGVYSYQYVFDSFDERQIILPSSETFELNQIGYVKANDLVKIYKSDYQFIAYSKNSSCDSVTFKVNGVTYVRSIDKFGFAKLNINLRPGVYTIESSTPYCSVVNTITVLPTLIGDNLVKFYRNDSQFKIKLVDSHNEPVASKNITFNINGVFYSRQTNDEGIACLNINLSPGKYIITAIDPLTGLRMSYNVTVLPVLYAENIVSQDTSCCYKVKLVDGMGYALPDKSISFNIGGVIYNSTTDANGEAKLLLNLMPGKYIVTAQYLSAKISNDIVILKK